jgi:hypothetical protein
MIGEYDSEQTRLRQTIAELRSEIDGYAADSVRADKFIELVKRCTEFDVLTLRMLNELVEKVVVFEGDRSSGKRVQRVDIYLSFIGNFDILDEPATQTPEEIEAERKAEERRRKARDRQREYRAKKKTA